MNAASPIDAMRAQQSVATKSDLLTLLASQRVKDSLKQVTGKLLNPERLVRLAVHSVKTTPKLQLCTTSSVLGSIMLAGSFGLEPNTPSQQCFLIPYKKYRKVAGKWTNVYECQFQFGYRGMITLAYRSGIVTRLKAEAVREEDEFDYSEGSNFFLKYKKTLRDRGKLIGAFCFTELKTDKGAASVLPGDFIESVRDKSQTYRTLRAAVIEARTDIARAKAEAALAETPWVLWEDAMWAKTAIKHHTGQLPMFDSGHTILAAASALDDAGDAGVIDMEDFVDADAAIAAANGEINLASENEDQPPAEQEETRGPAQIPLEVVVNNMPPIELTTERESVHAPAEERAAPRQATRKAEAPPSNSSMPEEPAGLFGPAE